MLHNFFHCLFLIGNVDSGEEASRFYRMCALSEEEMPCKKCVHSQSMASFLTGAPANSVMAKSQCALFAREKGSCANIPIILRSESACASGFEKRTRLILAQAANKMLYPCAAL